MQTTIAQDTTNAETALVVAPAERAFAPIIEMVADSAVGSDLTVEEAKARIRRVRARHEDDWFDLGVWLAIVRENVPPGEFLALLEEVGLEERQAQRAMRIAREGADLRPLGLTRADLLLRLKQPKRNEYMRTHDVARMTSRQLEREIAAILAENRPEKPVAEEPEPLAVPLDFSRHLTIHQVWALGVYGLQGPNLNAEAVEERHTMLAKAFARRPELRESLGIAKTILDHYFGKHARTEQEAA